MAVAIRDKVTEDALSLSIQEDIDLAWAEEAESRVTQIETGEANLVPGEEVFSRLRATYGG